MRSTLFVLSVGIALFGVTVAGPAVATAQIGGSISLSGGNDGSGSCVVNRQVPTTTRQDTFNLVAATACHGGSADVSLTANASAPSIGLSAHALDTGTGSSASAFVSLSDVWTIGVPVGVPVGASFTLPVSFRLEGGAAGSMPLGRYLDVEGAVGQFGTASGIFQFGARVDTAGAYDRTFAGMATFTNYGPSLPTLAVFESSLYAPFVSNGAVDFLHTLSVAVDVPTGFSVTSSSGATLFAVTPVPEPQSILLLCTGLAAIGARRFAARRRIENA